MRIAAQVAHRKTIYRSMTARKVGYKPDLLTHLRCIRQFYTVRAAGMGILKMAYGGRANTMFSPSSILWVVQNNLGTASDILDFVSAIRRSGAGVCEVSVIPFSEDIPEVVHNGPIVAYGSVTFVSAAQASGRWTPGVFASSDMFTYNNWVLGYGDMLLNDAGSVERSTIGNFALTNRLDEEDIFVRPELDSKSFNGETTTVGRFRDWCKTACTGVLAGVDATTSIIVGQPYGIDAEWRLFVCDGSIVASSRYRHRGCLDRIAGAPDEILAFANEAILRWNPCPVYVLDVCLSGGNPYIVEAQGFNSAGHYAASMDAIVSAVNPIALRIWESVNYVNH